MKELIIHCSASPNGRDDRASDIHRWHKEKGWDGIGYHHVITIDGEVEAGRPIFWQGAHAGSHNPDSIGVCIIGTDVFNITQWDSLERLVKGYLTKYPNIKVFGHNEISDKKCPGFDVQWWLKTRKLRGSV